MSKEDKENLENLFQRQIEIYRAKNKEAESSFLAEMSICNKKIKDLEDQISSIISEKEEISNKYGFPFVIDNCYTWLPEKFVNEFEHSLKDKSLSSRLLKFEQLCYAFDINSNLLNSDYFSIVDDFRVGKVGWEPSFCY